MSGDRNIGDKCAGDRSPPHRCVLIIKPTVKTKRQRNGEMESRETERQSKGGTERQRDREKERKRE